MENQGEILNDRDDQDRALVLTVREVATQLRCSEDHIRRLIASGELPAMRIGDGARSPYRVPREALKAHIARRVEQGVHRVPKRPELKTTRRCGSSGAWAFKLSSVSPAGGFNG